MVDWSETNGPDPPETRSWKSLCGLDALVSASILRGSPRSQRSSTWQETVSRRSTMMELSQLDLSPKSTWRRVIGKPSTKPSGRNWRASFRTTYGTLMTARMPNNPEYYEHGFSPQLEEEFRWDTPCQSSFDCTRISRPWCFEWIAEHRVSNLDKIVSEFHLDHRVYAGFPALHCRHHHSIPPRKGISKRLRPSHLDQVTKGWREHPGPTGRTWEADEAHKTYVWTLWRPTGMVWGSIWTYPGGWSWQNHPTPIRCMPLHGFQWGARGCEEGKTGWTIWPTRRWPVWMFWHQRCGVKGDSEADPWNLQLPWVDSRWQAGILWKQYPEDWQQPLASTSRTLISRSKSRLRCLKRGPEPNFRLQKPNEPNCVGCWVRYSGRLLNRRHTCRQWFPCCLAMSRRRRSKRLNLQIRLLRFAKANSDVGLDYRRLGSKDDITFVAYSDASFACRSDLSSQGGHMVVMVSKEVANGMAGHYVIVDWRSWKLQRVARSTLCAESQAASEAADALLYTVTFWNLVWQPWLGLDTQEVTKMPLQPRLVVDAKALYDLLVKPEVQASSGSDKRTTIEVLVTQDKLACCGGKTMWVSSELQYADGLTKDSAAQLLADRMRSHLTRLKADETFQAAKKKDAGQRKKNAEMYAIKKPKRALHAMMATVMMASAMGQPGGESYIYIDQSNDLLVYLMAVISRGCPMQLCLCEPDHMVPWSATSFPATRATRTWRRTCRSKWGADGTRWLWRSGATSWTTRRTRPWTSRRWSWNTRRKHPGSGWQPLCGSWCTSSIYGGRCLPWGSAPSTSCWTFSTRTTSRDYTSTRARDRTASGDYTMRSTSRVDQALHGKNRRADQHHQQWHGSTSTTLGGAYDHPEYLCHWYGRLLARRLLVCT